MHVWPDEALPAFFAELAGWAAAAGVPSETVAYGPDPDQVVELRRAPEPRGVVLVLHGGFWRAAYDRSSTVALATALTRQGWTTANAEYRRLGPGTWREMLADVAAAAETVGADRAIGHSAGGHLALWLAAQRPLRRCVALGAVCDLGAAARAGLGRGAAQELLGGAPDDAPDAYAAADPARLVPLGTAHVVVHGTEDEEVPVEIARSYAATARAARDDCTLVELPGIGHYELVDPRARCFSTIVEALGGGEHGSLRPMVPG